MGRISLGLTAAIVGLAFGIALMPAVRAQAPAPAPASDGKTLFIRILRPFASPLPILCERSSNSICSTIVGIHYVSKLQSFREDYENLMENGVSIDQGIAYLLMLVALVLTYLIHPSDASSPYKLF